MLLGLLPPVLYLVVVLLGAVDPAFNDLRKRIVFGVLRFRVKFEVSVFGLGEASTFFVLYRLVHGATFPFFDSGRLSGLDTTATWDVLFSLILWWTITRSCLVLVRIIVGVFSF